MWRHVSAHALSNAPSPTLTLSTDARGLQAQLTPTVTLAAASPGLQNGSTEFTDGYTVASLAPLEAPGRRLHSIYLQPNDDLPMPVAPQAQRKRSLNAATSSYRFALAPKGKQGAVSLLFQVEYPFPSLLNATAGMTLSDGTPVRNVVRFYKKMEISLVCRDGYYPVQARQVPSFVHLSMLVKLTGCAGRMRKM